MAKTTEMVEVTVSSLKPYERNAKNHPAEQIEKLKDSIQEFGFISPCLIDEQNRIIAGHGRVEAAKQLGFETVPCVYVEGLSEEQRRAYIIADNRLTELGGWDSETLWDELLELDISDFDVELTGFDIPEHDEEWFETRKRFDQSREEGNEEYNSFLDKFEQPKTTDDCYTPDNIYEVIVEYVENEYNLKRENFVRPFYPGGDYQSEKYKSTDIIVDNPPFSILSEILDFYIENEIKFFLFAPALSVLGYTSREAVTAISLYQGITYENGATIPTSCITNLGPKGIAAVTAPELTKKLAEANKANKKMMHKSIPKYDYPVEVLTSAKMGYLSKYGEKLEISREESVLIRAMDAQKEAGKSIFGSALLLSERAAAERAAAERAAAERAAAERAAAERAAAERAAAETWLLSERERKIVKSLGGVIDE